MGALPPDSRGRTASGRSLQEACSWECDGHRTGPPLPAGLGLGPGRCLGGRGTATQGLSRPRVAGVDQEEEVGW